MSRAQLVLSMKSIREKAKAWIDKAPDGTRLDFKAPKRTVPQSDKMWAMLTEVAEQVPYHGMKLTPDDFKLLFLDALKREVRMLPNLENNGFVSMGRSSSDLSKDEMSMLIELIYQFGATHDVVFKEAVYEDMKR